MLSRHRFLPALSGEACLRFDGSQQKLACRFAGDPPGSGRLVSANAGADPLKSLFHAVLDIERRVRHDFLPSCCAWLSRRPPNVGMRSLTQLANVKAEMMDRRACARRPEMPRSGRRLPPAASR